MDSTVFIQEIQEKLEPIAPIILPSIIKKQLTEVGATEDNLTPEMAKELMTRIERALEMFIGPDGTKLAHKMMIKELRKCAPEYFDDE
jgi:hypothetical protein